jgi:predicted ATPase
MMVSVSLEPFITRSRVRNFGCIQDCELTLTRLHALVGPNDSGKSTLLRALAAGQHILFEDDSSFDHVGREIELEWSDAWTFTLSRQNRPPHSTVEWWAGDTKRGSGPIGWRPEERRYGGYARVVRLDPDEMRKPSHLIPTSQGISLGQRGNGLPAVYDALLARRRRAFDAIERQVIELFPHVESLVLANASSNQKQLGVQLRGHSEPIGAPDISEGMLYFLAFRALQHLDPTPLVLVEEPENGLHPARIREVVDVLREVSKSMQVVMATHSPLVINELAGDEVSVITRDDQGTHANLLSRTPRYEERASVYKNGEIWLSYGDGKQEAALLEGKPAP